MAEILTILQLSIAAIFGLHDADDAIICEVMPLEMYGIEGEPDESICASIVDYTDFTIVVDKEHGDIVAVEFGKDNEPIAMETIYRRNNNE